MLVEFEQNCMVRSIQNFDAFWQSVNAILEDVPVTETSFDAKISIQRLSNQVQSCTEHGRLSLNENLL